MTKSGTDLRKVLISAKLIIVLLKHGTAACKAVKGIPHDARLMMARFDSEGEVVELTILSQSWDDDDEFFVPVFERDHGERSIVEEK
jgi:hypothetical protein